MCACASQHDLSAAISCVNISVKNIYKSLFQLYKETIVTEHKEIITHTTSNVNTHNLKSQLLYSAFANIYAYVPISHQI